MLGSGGVLISRLNFFRTDFCYATSFKILSSLSLASKFYSLSSVMGRTWMKKIKGIKLCYMLADTEKYPLTYIPMARSIRI